MNSAREKKNNSMSPSGEGMPKVYEPKRYERDIYHAWESAGFFNPDTIKTKQKRRSFSIVMPPPNTTGKLHLGHASAIAYEDLMIRYKRLQGFKTVYVPGTDHAAIATQNKVERLLAEKGESRQKLGREKFLERVRSYVQESQGEIKEQIRRSGASCDWSREAYTYDDVSSRVVNEVFIQMFEDDLIYRGSRIVNWCIRCSSTLADDEVKYIEKKSPFYYLKYGPVVIGTARPETKFLDKVIVVHPDDKRYQDLIGKEFEVPWIEGTVKARVIADKIVDPKLGTGAMTITPAHSFEDFNLAKKHTIEIVQIIDTDGRLTEAVGTMKGLPVDEARQKVVAQLKKKGLIEKIDNNYVHNLSVCYRCDTPVQPLISKQWFVDVNKKVPGQKGSLKKLATEMVRTRDIDIIPERFRKVYFHWLDNLHDWCISRQIWWGHRIPVWYCSCGEAVASSEEPKTKCKKCNAIAYHQDEDTLDTWFSSATWTFSTLLDRDHQQYNTLKQWIKQSPDLKLYHPTSVLETGYDILFFWVARMVLVTAYVLHEKPFSHVYLHGMVRDREGRKMSKSLGNGIDPNEVIDQYGADALRLSLIIGSGPGQDVRLYNEKIAGYRNFVNKLWNISRFILMSVEAIRPIAKRPRARTFAQRWILNRLEQITHEVTQHLDRWQFSLAGEVLYKFTWEDFADWYIEIAKVESSASPKTKKSSDEILLYILGKLLIVWHPFAPFVTEVIGKEYHAERPLIVAEWPRYRRLKPNQLLTRRFSELQDIINSIRRVRAEHSVGSDVKIRINLTSTYDWKAYYGIIEKFCRATIDESFTSGEKLRGTGYMIYLDLTFNVDAKKYGELRSYIRRLEAKLNDKNFLANAPEAIIEQERKKLANARAQLNT